MTAATPLSLAGAVWTVLVVLWTIALWRPLMAALDWFAVRLGGRRRRVTVRAGQRRPARTIPARFPAGAALTASDLNRRVRSTFAPPVELYDWRADPSMTNWTKPRRAAAGDVTGTITNGRVDR